RTAPGVADWADTPLGARPADRSSAASASPDRDLRGWSAGMLRTISIASDSHSHILHYVKAVFVAAQMERILVMTHVQSVEMGARAFAPPEGSPWQPGNLELFRSL